MITAVAEAPRKGGRPNTDPTTHRVPRTHSLTPDAAAIVARLAAELGLSKSAVVELAVRRLAAAGITREEVPR